MFLWVNNLTGEQQQSILCKRKQIIKQRGYLVCSIRIEGTRSELS
jgi:hypothetical protein